VSYLNMHGIPTAASEPTGYAVDCHACGPHGEPHPTPAAADQLAGLHDDIHHQGVPTATVHPA
jgi:hypothetical protein